MLIFPKIFLFNFNLVATLKFPRNLIFVLNPNSIIAFWVQYVMVYLDDFFDKKNVKNIRCIMKSL